MLFFVLFCSGRSYGQPTSISHDIVNDLLVELDDVIEDYDIESIPNALQSKCTLALIQLSVDGREDYSTSPSKPEEQSDADRLTNKLKQVHLELGGSIRDRQGFMRDEFTIDGGKWLIEAIQYYSFIDYYDNPVVPNNVFKLFEWKIFLMQSKSFVTFAYHLERSYSSEFGVSYFLGHTPCPHYHETLISFLDRCPSYMELKSLIIGDLNGDERLFHITASGYPCT